MSPTSPKDTPVRRVAPLYAAGLVTAFGAHSIAAGLGGYNQSEHASLLTLGILLAVYDGAEILLKPVFGSLTDRIGPRPVLLGELVAFALASAAFVLAGNPAVLGVAHFAQGAAAAAFSPAAGALIARLAPAPGMAGPSAATAPGKDSATPSAAAAVVGRVHRAQLVGPADTSG